MVSIPQVLRFNCVLHVFFVVVFFGVTSCRYVETMHLLAQRKALCLVVLRKRVIGEAWWSMVKRISKHQGTRDV